MLGQMKYKIFVNRIKKVSIELIKDFKFIVFKNVHPFLRTFSDIPGVECRK